MPHFECSASSRSLALFLVWIVGCSAEISDPVNGGGSNSGATPGAGSTAIGSGGGGGSGGRSDAGGAAGSTSSAGGATASFGGTATGLGGSVSGTGGTGGSSAAGAAGTPPIDPAVAQCKASNGALNAGRTPARRLTRTEFDNTVRELLGATGTPSAALAADERIGPFYSNAIAPITDLQVQQHAEVAAKLALEAKSRMKSLSPCDLATDTGTTCATRFVTAFGQKAYRRPLSATEVTRYVSLYDLGRKSSEGAANGFRLVVETMLQSPYFLYHHDVGASGSVQAGTVALGAFELASRLSYFLWNSPPDDALFAAAASGALTQEATIRTEVGRLLADPRAATTIAMFHRQWLGTDDLEEQERDAKFYPDYDATLAGAMQREMALFTNHVILKGDGRLGTLLTSNAAFPSGKLFGVYGVAQPADYQAGTVVMLDPERRAGILTQAAFLTRWAHATQTSPVHRGKLIRTNVMCGTVPPPPPNVNTSPPPATAVTSTRERFAQHVADPTCAGCHQLMDPIGLGFEHYDAVGAYRTTDGMGPVDASGSILGVSSELSGSFVGAVQLANRLAASTEVAHCFSNQWFRFSLGRMESADDACSIQSIHEGFRASGGNIRELLTQIAMSPAFRHVRLNGG